MDLDILKETIKATEVFHVSAKTGYQVKQSMQLVEKIVSRTNLYQLCCVVDHMSNFEDYVESTGKFVEFMTIFYQKNFS